MGVLDEVLGIEEAPAGVSRRDSAFQIPKETQKNKDIAALNALKMDLAHENDPVYKASIQREINELQKLIDSGKSYEGLPQGQKVEPVKNQPKNVLDKVLGISDQTEELGPSINVEIAGGVKEKPQQIAQATQLTEPTALEKVGRTAAGLADTVIGGIQALPGTALAETGYAGVRALEGLGLAQPGQAERGREAVYKQFVEPFTKPVGETFGVTETPEYKGEASQQVMKFIGDNVDKGADWISTKTGIPKADVQNMMNTLLAAAPAAGKGVKNVLQEQFAAKVPVAPKVEPTMVKPKVTYAELQEQLQRKKGKPFEVSEPTAAEVPIEQRTFEVPEEQPAIASKANASNLEKINQQKLEKVGITNFRKSALVQNPKEATSQYVTSKASQETYGHGMTEQINHEKSALINHFGDIEKQTGGHVVRYGTAEQQGDLIKEGKTVKTALQEGKENYNKQTADLYKEADEKYGSNGVNLNEFNNYLKSDDQFAYQEEKNLQSAVNSFVKRKGFMDEEGNLKPLTVAESEEIRKFINSKYHYETKDVAANLKSKLDDDVFSQVGGETYQKARKHFQAGKETYDNPKAISNLVADENVNQKIPDEKVMSNILATIDESQFRHLIGTLKKDGKDKALSQIQTSLVNKIQRAGKSEVNEPWNSMAAAKEAAALSEKLKVAFNGNPKELAKIYDGIEAGNIIYIPTKYPGAGVQTHLLKQKFSEIALKRSGAFIGASAGAGIGDAIGAGIGGFVGEKIGETGAEAMRAGRQAKQLKKEIKYGKISDIGKKK